MPTPSEELIELIASFTTGKGEIEVVKLDNSFWPAPLYLNGNLKDGTNIDVEGVLIPVIYAPMTIGGESSGSLLLNNRDLTFQMVNDLVAENEDLIPLESDEKPTMEVSTYIANRDGTLTTIAKGPLKYFANNVSYNQSNNACTLSCSTTRTNDGETGESQTIARFPMMRGLTQ